MPVILDDTIKIQQYYRIPDIAQMCKVDQKTVRRWITAKKLKAYRIGGAIRIPQSELLKFIESY